MPPLQGHQSARGPAKHLEHVPKQVVEIALATWFPHDFGSFNSVLRYDTGDLSILA